MADQNDPADPCASLQGEASGASVPGQRVAAMLATVGCLGVEGSYAQLGPDVDKMRS